MRTPFRVAGVLPALFLLLAGCYHYVPSGYEAVPPGEDVRVYLTRQGMARLVDDYEEGLGGGSSPVVRGTVVERRSDRLLVRIPVATRRVGFHQTRLGQQIPIPVDDIVQVEERRLHRWGTGLMVGGAVGATAAVIFLILDDAVLPTNGDDGEPPEFRIPIITLPAP